MAHLVEKVRFGVPSGDDPPTHNAGAGAEEHDHAPVSVGARYDSAIDAPTPRFAGQQCSRGAESLVAPATRNCAASR